MGAYCLRSAYAVFERVLTPKIEARKLLFYFYFFTHSFTLPDLTSAFGGQYSIQLSYGCPGLSIGEAGGGCNGIQGESAGGAEGRKRVVARAAAIRARV